MLFNCIVFLYIIAIIDQLYSVKIDILSNDTAFIKYQEESNDKEIIFKQPLNNKLSLSLSLGDLHMKKELERSKFKSMIFTDKKHLYMQSSIDRDNFVINSICKFDYEQLAAYTFDRVCCLGSLINGNRTLDRKVCKLEVSSTASVCYIQLEVSKKNFDFSLRDEYKLTLTSNIFSSGDMKCSSESQFNSPLAEGLPQTIVVTHGLELKWIEMDYIATFGNLEIGIPVDSVEAYSKTIFPLRILSAKPLSTVEVVCSYGADLTLSTISFDGTSFSGDFTPSNKENSLMIMVLNKIDSGSTLNSNPFVREHLVNLEMKVSAPSVFTSQHAKAVENWISCRVQRAQFLNSKVFILRGRNEEAPKQVHVKVNVDGFVIIPITTEKTYFAILNEIPGPIKLQKSDLQMFSMHSVRDGSFVDVTEKTHCQPISNNSIQCPLSGKVDNFQTPLKDANWKILLSMKSWQKLLTYPIELWQAVDWRTVIKDKILNRITNWRYYDSKSQSCRPTYQVTRCQLLARFTKENTYSDQKQYFGQRSQKDYPLFDVTHNLDRSNVLLSSGNQHIDTVFNNNIVLIRPISAGVSDISIVNDYKRIIAFDRIIVDDSPVSVVDLHVTCIHRFNVTQTSSRFNPSFRSIVVRSQASRSAKESCYLKISVQFSDNSTTSIQDYPSSFYKIVIYTPEKSFTIPDLDSFVYQPYKYRSPGRFQISIFEPDQCSLSKLIWSKHVDLYRPLEQHTSASPIVPTLTSLVPIVLSRHNLSGIFPRKKTTTTTDYNDTKIDTDSLFLSMKILIGLVGLVVLIVILNCVIKLKQRKSVRLLDRNMTHCSAYTPIDKLTTSTYSPIDLSNVNSTVQHPPLLPPPGPLYNASDSSQLDLTVNATPDIFWDLPQVSGSIATKQHHLAMIGFQNMHLQTRTSLPSPHSDPNEYGYIISKATKMPTTYNYPSDSTHDSDSVVTGGSSGKNCSQIAMNVPPPCAPLRWNNNFCSNQFALYYPCSTDANTELSHPSRENSSQNSLPQSHSSSWEIKQTPVLPPSGFSNSIENVCEKSSGVGSLTSTKPDSDCSKKDSGCPGSPKTAQYSLSQ